MLKTQPQKTAPASTPEASCKPECFWPTSYRFNSTCMLSPVWFFCDPMDYSPLYMRFPGQEYWSELSFPTLRDLPNPGIKPRLWHLHQQVDPLSTLPPMGGIDWKFQWLLSLGSISLLDQLTELRETFYLMDINLLIKRYDTGRARWTRCIKYGERVRSSMGHSTKTCSLTQKLSELCPFRFLWRLHYKGMVDYITSDCIFTHLPLPGGWGWGWNC